MITRRVATIRVHLVPQGKPEQEDSPSKNRPINQSVISTTAAARGQAKRALMIGGAPFWFVATVPDCRVCNQCWVAQQTDLCAIKTRLEVFRNFLEKLILGASFVSAEGQTAGKCGWSVRHTATRWSKPWEPRLHCQQVVLRTGDASKQLTPTNKGAVFTNGRLPVARGRGAVLTMRGRALAV